MRAMLYPILVILLAGIILIVFLAGCAAPSPPPLPVSGHTLTLTSGAYAENASIPARYTCDGQGESPPLSWGDVPAGTRSFALIMQDPDAPSGTFTHWVLFNIPGDQRELSPGIAPGRELPGGGIQGTSSARTTGYTPPCPPLGSTHHYIVTLYALDTIFDPVANVDAATLRNTMGGHVLGTGQLTGTYLRV